MPTTAKMKYGVWIEKLEKISDSISNEKSKYIAMQILVIETAKFKNEATVKN